MKIYILADMEGISGIRMPQQAKFDSEYYSAGCKLMMDDMNVAIGAAFEAGATEVVACDTHGGGGQVRVEMMDPRATYETPGLGLMMPSLTKDFDGLVLLGHHAQAGTLNGFLDHTMSSKSWFEYRINNIPVGEIGIEAAFAAHFDVPVIAMSGDEAAASEAKALLGCVECAVVKRGIGRNRANCLSIDKAHSRIRKAISLAMQDIGRFSPWRPELPATIELTVYRSDMADNFEGRADIERVGARTLRTQISTLKNVYLI